MDVKLYTIDCPRCKVLEKKLADAGVSYERITDRDMMIEKGYDLMPVLEVDGTLMNFGDACRWVREAKTE